MKENLQLEFMNLSYKLNKAAGKLNDVKVEDLQNQLKLIQEELNEGVDDLKLKDYIGVLDAYCDLKVTVEGLGMMLESLGFKTQEAAVATARNNDTKFIPVHAVTLVNNTLNKYTSEGIDCKPEYNEEFMCYVIKDQNNKIRKPIGFVSNDLSEFVPEGYK